MKSVKAILALLFSTGLVATVPACAGNTDEDGDLEGGESALEKGTNSDQWLYNGKLPHLVEPSIVVAQAAHTVRVSGFLPPDYDNSQLPFHARDAVSEEGGRTKISVVYPIATGSSVNHPPGDDYVTERVYPRRTDSSAAWGGFPFISYVSDESKYKGIAFHGPITAKDGEWKLIRGPVSHGCNRMQGEHIVELAHLIGVDMTNKLYPASTILRDRRVPVKVIRAGSDTWNGQAVDVDYPTAAGVKRPTGNVKMFKIWRSDDFKTWVCKVDPRRPPKSGEIPADYCSSVRGLRDSADAAVGPGR